MNSNSKKELKPVIHLRIIVWLALKNLAAKRLRTGLTIGGIVIGLGSVVFLVSLALGLHQVVDNQVIGSKSVKTIDVTSPNAAVIQLGKDNLAKVQQFNHVSSVGAAYVVPGKIDYQNSLSDTVVYAVDPSYLSLSALKYTAGKPTLADDDGAIVNTSLLNLIGISSPSKALNHPLKLQVSITAADGSVKKTLPLTLTITGVADTGSGAEVYTKSKHLADGGQVLFSQWKVVADDKANVPQIRQQIEGLGLTTASPLDTLNEINTVFQFFTLIVAGFGGIGMIIAVLGMFNTMTISLLERTSEIGLMVSLGASKSDIQRLLVTEAVLLSLFGGVGGIIIAWLLGVGIDFILNSIEAAHGVADGISLFSITPALVGGTLLLAIVVGLLVVIYPARRASRINPIDALRFE